MNFHNDSKSHERVHVFCEKHYANVTSNLKLSQNEIWTVDELEERKRVVVDISLFERFWSLSLTYAQQINYISQMYYLK